MINPEPLVTSSSAGNGCEPRINAARKRAGLASSFWAFAALSTSAATPLAEGAAIDVPLYMSAPRITSAEIAANAAPGAMMSTPKSPSFVGPRLVNNCAASALGLSVL